jgi:hypothetical protein
MVRCSDTSCKRYLKQGVKGKRRRRRGEGEEAKEKRQRGRGEGEEAKGKRRRGRGEGEEAKGKRRRSEEMACVREGFCEKSIKPKAKGQPKNYTTTRKDICRPCRLHVYRINWGVKLLIF